MGKGSCCAAFLVALGAAVVGLTFVIWPHRTSVCPNCPPLTLKPSSTDYCEADTTGFSVADVEKRGYSIQRDFISAEEKETLMGIFNELESDLVVNPGGNAGNNVGYKQPALSGIQIFERMPSLKAKIMEIAKNTITETEGRIDIINKHDGNIGDTPIFFTTNASEPKTLKFGWHQDTENYFYFQDLMNFLDFYIMLQKPDPRSAGLGLVPWDLLRDRAPEFFELARGDRSRTESWGAGAFGASEDGTGMTYRDMVHDRSYRMDFQLDDVACFPELREGDLLLFRGDTIHRTQEHNTYRTSLNVLAYPQRLMNSEKLFSGGLDKYTFIYNSANNYLWFLYWAGVYRGREHWQMKCMDYVYKARLYGGYYLRKTLRPLREAVDAFLDERERAK